MGTLALDIETASPFREPAPGENDTACFEWVAVAVGFREGPEADPETDVLFRRGGWDVEHTADLFDQLFAWCADRDVDRTLTYNGEHFDRTHLSNWAASVASTCGRDDVESSLARLFSTHVDLAPLASDRHAEQLLDGQPVLPLWKACDLEGVTETRVRYDEYDFDEAYLDGLDVDAPFVTGKHVGQVLGSRYVEGVAAEIEGTHTHRELRRLLYEYAVGDVDVLFDLYDALTGGESAVDSF